MQRKVYFLLGVTGDLGTELLRQLARDEQCEVVCLVRAKGQQDYQNRMAKVIAEVKGDPKRIRAVEGDVTAERLGLADAEYQRLTETAAYIVHSAADTRFNAPIEELRKVNVEGTKHVLRLAGECRAKNPDFKALGWMGTAYVAGRRKGVVSESELTDRFGFNNGYEQSKYESESLVRAAVANGLPAVVFRPSVIVGASYDGHFKTTSALYPIIMLYSRLLPSQVLPSSNSIRIDIVPQDYVAKSILYLLARSENMGRTFHLAAGEGKSVSVVIEFVKIIVEGLELKNVRFVPTFLWFVIFVLSRAFNPKLHKGIKKLMKLNDLGGYEGYVQHVNPEFSVTATETALRGSGIEMPEPLQFLRACVAYAKEHYVKVGATT